MSIQHLPYIDVQHDALSVFDDVEQGVVAQEDIWISAYQSGSSSVHGKARVSTRAGGGSDLVARDGVSVQRLSKTNFTVSIPALDLKDVPLRFPRQIVHPPYQKKTAIAAPLHVNAIALSPRGDRIAVGGPDGYLVVLPTSPEARKDEQLELKGHVGDVLDVKWFPSGEVLLSSSSDLSIRVWGAKDGINPRTLKGHTKGITSLAIVDVGKVVVSVSLDGTIRIWEVGSAKEIKKIRTANGRGVHELVLLNDPAGLAAMGAADEERLLVAATQTSLEIFRWSTGESLRSIEWDLGSNLVSFAYSPGLGLFASGHTNGTVALRRLGDLENAKLIRRNEASIYSLKFDDQDILVGTAAGLPARLGVRVDEDGMDVHVKEEYGGWEAVGVETWSVGEEGAWCAGGEGGLRRY